MLRVASIQVGSRGILTRRICDGSGEWLCRGQRSLTCQSAKVGSGRGGCVVSIHGLELGAGCGAWSWSQRIRFFAVAAVRFRHQRGVDRAEGCHCLNGRVFFFVDDGGAGDRGSGKAAAGIVV